MQMEQRAHSIRKANKVFFFGITLLSCFYCCLSVGADLKGITRFPPRNKNRSRVQMKLAVSAATQLELERGCHF